MTRLLAVVLALAIAALGWQSWRLNNASHTIETQGAALKSKTQELTKKNSQLIGLSILTVFLRQLLRFAFQRRALRLNGVTGIVKPPALDRGTET